ncbi:hypothetical protein SHJG_7969 [Streptomyces hygroscopicus subsp. jinggangensis 5008]|nr:hypothetical protein SHJG_7969 [Streptomyces hygroscopicus subsp. jinggangensis 5008]AGF67393.1 hypothetical protein SHJGH_7731 [Streptomyces hygroscopicus subsp. jinggangensis TL01]
MTLRCDFAHNLILYCKECIGLPENVRGGHELFLRECLGSLKESHHAR